MKIKASAQSTPYQQPENDPQRPSTADRPRGATRRGPSVLGYFVAGLALTRGIGSAHGFNLPRPPSARPAPIDARWQVNDTATYAIGSMNGQQGLAKTTATQPAAAGSSMIAWALQAPVTPRDTRPQAELPVRDVSMAEQYDLAFEVTTSAVHFLQNNDINKMQDFKIKRELKLPVPVKEQARFINSLISNSPTLTDLLRKANRSGFHFKLAPTTSWEDGSRTLEIDEKLFDTPEACARAPSACIQNSLHLVTELTGLAAHAQQGHLQLEFNRHISQPDFEKNFFAVLSGREARKLWTQLQVAKEVFDSTGVILKFADFSYRRGQAQAIFHAEGLSQEAKIAALADYMLQTHPGFKGAFKKAAAAEWQDIQRENRQRQEL